MSSKRSIKRRRQKADAKNAKKNVQKALNELASIPKACHKCSADFDPKSDFCLDNWVVNVSDRGIHMFCDVCKTED